MISARQAWNNVVKSRPKLHRNIENVKPAIWQAWYLQMPTCVFFEIMWQSCSFSPRVRKRQIKDALLGQVLPWRWQMPLGTGVTQGGGHENQEQSHYPTRELPAPGSSSLGGKPTKLSPKPPDLLLAPGTRISFLYMLLPPHATKEQRRFRKTHFLSWLFLNVNKYVMIVLPKLVHEKILSSTQINSFWNMTCIFMYIFLKYSTHNLWFHKD